MTELLIHVNGGKSKVYQYYKFHYLKLQQLQKGFTLLELMVVIAIVAILAAIAIPSYQEFIKKNTIQKTKSIMMMQSNELDRWRSRQLNYAGFVPQSQTFDADNITFHYPATGAAKYDIQMVTITGSGGSLAATSFANTSVATNFIILAVPTNGGYPYIALSSHGIKCQSLDSAITAVTVFNTNNCGTGSSPW